MASAKRLVRPLLPVAADLLDVRLGQRRTQLRLDLFLQPALEIGIGGEADPRHETQHRGRADARLLGELGGRLEPLERIVRQQRLRGAALGSGQLGQAVADPLGERNFDPGHFLTPRSRPACGAIDNPPDTV